MFIMIVRMRLHTVSVPVLISVLVPVLRLTLVHTSCSLQLRGSARGGRRLTRPLRRNAFVHAIDTTNKQMKVGTCLNACESTFGFCQRSSVAALAPLCFGAQDMQCIFSTRSTGSRVLWYDGSGVVGDGGRGGRGCSATQISSVGKS